VISSAGRLAAPNMREKNFIMLPDYTVFPIESIPSRIYLAKRKPSLIFA
jgi:hypothetical protein